MFDYANVDIVGDKVFVRYIRAWAMELKDGGLAPNPNEMQLMNEACKKRGATNCFDLFEMLVEAGMTPAEAIRAAFIHRAVVGESSAEPALFTSIFAGHLPERATKHGPSKQKSPAACVPSGR